MLLSDNSICIIPVPKTYLRFINAAIAPLSLDHLEICAVFWAEKKVKTFFWEKVLFCCGSAPKRSRRTRWTALLASVQ